MLNDRELQARVQHALSCDEQVDAARVGVTVQAGVVTLSGELPSFGMREAVEAAVLGVPEVLDIANELEVRPVASDSQVDAALAADVRQALETHFGAEAEHVKSTVRHGVVALHGSLASWHEVAAAEGAVGKLRGVEDVEEDMTVGMHSDEPRA